MEERKKTPKKKKESKAIESSLFFRVVFLCISVIVFGFLIFLLVGYIPCYKEEIANMTFKTYSNILYDYEIMMYSSNAEVTSSEAEEERIGIGVVIDPWNLNFGSTPAGSSYARYADLTNMGEKDAKIIFRTHGNISSFVRFDKNNFILGPKENVTVKITFESSLDEIGNYTGRIDRIVKIPKYDFLYSFW